MCVCVCNHRGLEEKAVSWQDMGKSVPRSDRSSLAPASYVSPCWVKTAFLWGIPTFSQGHAQLAWTVSLPNDPEFSHLLPLSVLSQGCGTPSSSPVSVCHPLLGPMFTEASCKISASLWPIFLSEICSSTLCWM